MDLDKAIELEPENTNAYNNRGLTYRELEEHQKALADFDKVIKLEPNNADAYGNRGLTYRALEKNKQAIADFDKAIELEPNVVAHYHNRGLVYRDLEKYEEAMADFNHALEIDKQNVGVLLSRCKNYHYMGYYQQALENLNTSIELDKAQASSWRAERGLLLSYLGRYAEAIECYEQNLQEDPDDYTTLYNIAVAIARWKGVADATEHIARARLALLAIRGTKNNVRALYGLGGLEALSGHTSPALNYLRRAISSSKRVIFWARHDIAWRDLHTDPQFQKLVFKKK